MLCKHLVRLLRRQAVCEQERPLDVSLGAREQRCCRVFAGAGQFRKSADCALGELGIGDFEIDHAAMIDMVEKDHDEA